MGKMGCQIEGSVFYVDGKAVNSGDSCELLNYSQNVGPDISMLPRGIVLLSWLDVIGRCYFGLWGHSLMLSM